VENTAGVVHQSHGTLEPASEHLRSEPAIVAGLALATIDQTSSVDWQGLIDDYDRIREHIEHVVPALPNTTRASGSRADSIYPMARVKESSTHPRSGRASLFRQSLSTI